jgi:hypothetical protein
MIPSAVVRSEVVVTLSPTAAIDSPVAPGETVVFDVLLAAIGDDAPLENVRFVQFDFSATTTGIEPTLFTWMLDLPAGSAAYQLYSNFPTPGAVYVATTPVEGAVLALDVVPARVAQVTVTVQTGGVLDALAAPVDEEDESQAVVSVGFLSPMDFTPSDGSLRGGLYSFTVQGEVLPDGDGDGTPDVVDVFPEDPVESVDTDEDGVGDNRDTDDDGDNRPDVVDAFPTDPGENADNDEDGVGDAADPDDDNDGIPDDRDEIPEGENEEEDDSNANANDNDRNTGPRATGGVCAASMLQTFAVSLGVLTFIRRRRRGA